jgi:sulfur relay (sulfurtransferase) complex TusBCD TusD component (DsrE family)
MGKLLIILFSPPMQSQNTNTACMLANATVEEGHNVTVFFDVEATYNLMKSQNVQASKIAELIKKGVKVLLCRESARIRGITTEDGLIEGVTESSLGKLAELMEEQDRVIALG